MTKFYDINKIPAQEGILVFGISMPKISNVQNAKKCFEYCEHFWNKIQYPHVGAAFIYSDGLYMNSNEPAKSLKKKLTSLMLNHKFEFKKILKKNPRYIPGSFSFISWSQILLESKDFTHYFGKLKQIYEKDKKFQKFVIEDIELSGKIITDESVDYILEEILIFYLASKGEIKIPNEYIGGKEKWVLWCYPGKPLKSEIYLYQKNPFKLKNSTNIYENSYYDLEEKKLYKYDEIDLSTF